MAKRTYYRKQSAEAIEALHESVVCKFDDKDVVFSIEKFETWRFLMHIKSKETLYRAWYNHGTGIGKITPLEIVDKIKKPAH